MQCIVDDAGHRAVEKQKRWMYVVAAGCVGIVGMALLYVLGDTCGRCWNRMVRLRGMRGCVSSVRVMGRWVTVWYGCGVQNGRIATTTVEESADSIEQDQPVQDDNCDSTGGDLSVFPIPYLEPCE